MDGMFFALLGAAIATVLAGIGSAKGVGGAAQRAGLFPRFHHHQRVRQGGDQAVALREVMRIRQ